MSEQKCICGDILSEEKLEEFSSDELKALNNLLDGKATKKDYQLLTQRREVQRNKEEPKKDDQKDMDFIQRQIDLGIE
mgnify:CR=1 FL=1